MEILSDPVDPDFKSFRPPVVAVEHLDGSHRILSGGKENSTVAS